MSSSQKRGTSSSKKRTAAKHTRPRKRDARSAKRSSRKRAKKPFRSMRWIGIFIAIIALIGLGYCLGSCWLNTDKYESAASKEHKRQTNLAPKTTRPPKVKPAPSKTELPSSKEKPIFSKTESSLPQEKPETAAHTKLAYRGEKPRLVVIIDDVHTAKQLHAIQRLPFPVTPSIFPPYSLSPHTEKLAIQAVHYMIHLPMESGNAKFDKQSKTLQADFDKAHIQARIKELRMLFPRAHYINNHTGSKFTHNKKAMQRLYQAMKEEGFAFIDSRTSGGNVVRNIAHAFGDDYVARDIFLDNEQSVPAIQKQLQKAVRLAKENGYAIAIGHPHKTTLKALALSKPLLKEVEVVYIEDIFREE